MRRAPIDGHYHSYESRFIKAGKNYIHFMKAKLLSTAIILAILQLLSNDTIGQIKLTDLQLTIHEKDSLFWTSYNNCDLASFRSFFTDDIEFYHDKGGLTLGVEALTSSMRQNLCEKKGFRLRRALVPGTVQIYPLEKNGTVYGAIISGDHDFFVTENGKPEFHSGQAKFTHVWLLKNNEWKMSRVLSYYHHNPNKTRL